MAHRTRAGTIAPRLLMLAAVLFCLFGFAIPNGSEGTVAAPAAVAGVLTADALPSVADTAHAEHGAHAPLAEVPQATVPAAGHSDSGHAAHGNGDGHGEHSVNCMPSASASPIAAAPAPDLAPAVVLEALALPRSAAVLTPAVVTRPPDLRSLCIQRV